MIIRAGKCGKFLNEKYNFRRIIGKRMNIKSLTVTFISF